MDKTPLSSLPLRKQHLEETAVVNPFDIPPKGPIERLPRWMASLLRKQHPEEYDEETTGAEVDPFGIPPSVDPIERFRRWRQAVLVLNSSRRFRYTLDLKQKEEKERIRRKLRAHAQVMRAALLFKEAGRRYVAKTELQLRLEKAGIRPVPKTELPAVMPRDYGIGEKQLMVMTRDFNYSALQDYGGVEGVANLLKTNIDRGITEDDADLISRQNAFGSNKYHKKGKGFWSFLWEASQYLPLTILMVAAALSLGLGIKTQGIKEGWYDGGSIAFAVCLVIVVTAISDYKQSLQFRHLVIDESSIDESDIKVIRNGKIISILIYDLVVGDVVPLKIDDMVPADGLLISGPLVIDEPSNKGGSELVFKDQESPFLMAGCTVAYGDGIMLVTAVGMNTKWGSEYMATKLDYNQETPLQVRQDIVATKIEKVGLAVAGALLVVLLARYFTGKTTNADGTVQYIKGQTSVMSAIDGVIKILTVAVTIVVVAVPKGLPLALSLTRAYSMRKMMADKGLVRRLSACETMGLATTICIDKIGILTLNQMTVVEAYVGEKNIAGASNVGSISPTVNSLLLEGIAQNCTGSVYEPENAAVEITGLPTEKAILGWGIELKMRFNEVRSKSKIIHASPFNSEKKRGGVAVHVGGWDVHVHWKGAAEIVLDLCTSWMDASGIKHDMTSHAVEKFQKQIEAMAAKSLRCVALAYKPFDLKEVPNEDQRVNWSLPEDDLILLAIVGMKDPCHPGVKDAVLLCTNAGVKVRMVTGDNLQTAKDIALECGILSENDNIDEVIVEGEVFCALSEYEKEQMVDKIKVMAKSSPIDKFQLVNALQERGHVVAVTGYDTNDVPALYEADIGLAMGIQGTKKAKEYSDIIILDDNFSSVVKLIRWGRSVYANIQKFIQFQLTVNVAALIIIVVAAVSSGNVPLNAVQLLWVNLIMDTLGALALVSEPPSDNLMKRSPVGRREPLITNIMWRNLLIQAFFQVAILLTLNIKGRSLLQLENHSAAKANEIKNTFIFNTFVLCQVFNEFNARKPEEFNIFEGVTKNHLFVGIIGVTIVLQAMIIEFLGKFTSTVKLSWQLWLVSIGIAFVSWPFAFLGKFIPVPQTPLKKLICTCLTNRRKAPRDEAGNSSLV